MRKVSEFADQPLDWTQPKGLTRSSEVMELTIIILIAIEIVLAIVRA